MIESESGNIEENGDILSRPPCYRNYGWGSTTAYGSKFHLIVIRDTMMFVRYANVFLTRVVLPSVKGVKYSVFPHDTPIPILR